MNKDEAAVSAEFGRMAWLYMQSPLHKEWTISSMQRWLLPPLMHSQYKIYFDPTGTKPVGFVSWAWLSRQVEQDYVANPNSLHPKDWKSGERGWVIDFIAPFGDTKRITEDLRTGLFANDVGRFLRAKKGSDTLKIMYVHGKNAAAKRKAELPVLFWDLKADY